MDTLDRRGWILGPQENREAFFLRVEALKRFFSHPPETIDHFVTDRDWEGALARMHALYDVEPNWIVAHYSNRGLAFFEGAATWIFHRGDLRIPIIQLREGLQAGWYLNLYSRDEVLAHEGVHAIRMQFDCPHFEEMFAYKTSRYLYRRLLGPLFQTSWEAVCFLGTLSIPIAVQLYALFWSTKSGAVMLSWIPLLLPLWLLARLMILHLVLRRAIHKMRPLLRNPQKAWATAVRMTDREIFQFAFLDTEKLQKLTAQEKTPRWALLRAKFFKP